MIIKALTIHQPWAALIMIGAKPYEFRAWLPPKSLIGQRIAIHAGREAGVVDAAKGLLWTIRQKQPVDCVYKAFDHGLAAPLLERIANGEAVVPMGAVLGTARLGQPFRAHPAIGTIFPAGSDFDQRYYAWPLEEVQPIEPVIPARGRLGLWGWSLPE